MSFVVETGIYISSQAVSSSHFVLFTCHTKLNEVTIKNFVILFIKKIGAN